MVERTIESATDELKQKDLLFNYDQVGALPYHLATEEVKEVFNFWQLKIPPTVPLRRYTSNTSKAAQRSLFVISKLLEANRKYYTPQAIKNAMVQFGYLGYLHSLRPSYLNVRMPASASVDLLEFLIGNRFRTGKQRVWLRLLIRSKNAYAKYLSDIVINDSWEKKMLDVVLKAYGKLILGKETLSIDSLNRHEQEQILRCVRKFKRFINDSDYKDAIKKGISSSDYDVMWWIIERLRNYYKKFNIVLSPNILSSSKTWERVVPSVLTMDKIITTE